MLPLLSFIKNFWKSIKGNLVQSIFVILGFYFFYEANNFLYQHNYKASVILFTFGIMLFILGFISKFKRFKAFGFEGELWGEVQKEAEILIKHLKELILDLSQSAFISLGGIGRFSGAIPTREIFQNLDNIVNKLKILGIEPEQIRKLTEPFDRLIIRDIASPIGRKIQAMFDESRKNYTLENKAPTPQINDLFAKEKKLIIDIFDNHIKNENIVYKLEKFFSTSKIFEPSDLEKLKNEFFYDFKNLDSYIKNRKFADEEKFFENKK